MGLRAGGLLGLALSVLVTLAGTAGAATGLGGSLPGPVGDCPNNRGVAAPGGTPWAQQALDCGRGWPLARGAGVTVAVVDSGVDANPQFGDRVSEGPDLAPPSVGAPADADCVGHGTSVASIPGKRARVCSISSRCSERRRSTIEKKGSSSRSPHSSPATNS